MRRTISASLLLTALLSAGTRGQELEPRAYLVLPVGVNIVALTAGRLDGDVSFDPSLPFEDVTASINTLAVGYVRTLNVLGRSANIAVGLPLVHGRLEGLALGERAMATRRGSGDPRIRFAINLIGAPAMDLRAFAGYRQDTTLGFSVVVVPPAGQYDSRRLINLGSNRWAFKPELGLSKRIDQWYIDVYGGAWLFTDNDDFFDGRVRGQAPLGSAQFHLGYEFRPGLWIALNTNFYTGGRTRVDGVSNVDLQRNSRIGATASLPIDRRQAIKISYSAGAYTTIGADFRSLGAAYQVAWGAGL